MKKKNGYGGRTKLKFMEKLHGNLKNVILMTLNECKFFRSSCSAGNVIEEGERESARGYRVNSRIIVCISIN